MNVVVVGGTGLIGRSIVDRLRAGGHRPVVASPSTGVDTTTGRGLADAVRGADVVVDVTKPHGWEDARVAMDFFVRSTQHLLEAEAAAGVRHHVALSVVGTERLLDSGWFRAKIVQESLIRSGPMPYTIVRATQFFEFLDRVIAHAIEGDTVRVPAARIQPIAAADVGVIVLDTALGAPVGGIVEAGGPESYWFGELVRAVAGEAPGGRRVVVDQAARYFGCVLEERTLLPAAGSRRGVLTLAQWRARR